MCKEDLPSVAKKLVFLTQPPLLAATGKGHTLCHWVAKNGDLEILQLLREHGAALSQPTEDENKMHPINCAAASGNIDIVRFLLHSGVDINVTDANGCAPPSSEERRVVKE